MIGELISAGSKLLGGIMDRNAAKDANAQAAAERAADRQMQFDFATKGIRWKAADAREAGLHPLFAMGAPTMSYNPVPVGTAQSESMGSTLASMGQDVGRAINATRTQNERQSAVSDAMTKLQLERGGLENELLRSQIASQNAKNLAASNPAMPSASTRMLVEGQGDSAKLVQQKPLEQTGVDPKEGGQEGGAVPDVGYARTRTGWAPVPSKDVKERIEDNLIQEVMWAVRNNLMPSLGKNKAAPNIKLEPGEFWEFDPWKQEYRVAIGMRRGWPIWKDERR